MLKGQFARSSSGRIKDRAYLQGSDVIAATQCIPLRKFYAHIQRVVEPVQTAVLAAGERGGSSHAVETTLITTAVVLPLMSHQSK
ncbi:hypothetical protein CR152_00025 [Massilia violaceinigra]|uniref:Uncharacterized protein n=1 Tax=Massilia violaceinigra TaxID=2045208 RepID=A0A2D2DDN7_9BURK|nr:hypothetical protein CR152_00025 [Massilia violaceinigra]